MYTPNLVSILFYDQPLSIFKFDDVMPTSRIRDKEACGRWEGTLRSQADKDNSLMCYLMYFDPISSRIQSVFQPYFWSGPGEF